MPLTMPLSTLTAGAALALAVALPGGAASDTAATAYADGRDDTTERRIDRTRGAGLRACRVARRHVGGGRCTRVVEDRADDDRYEVTILRGAYRYEVDLSSRFRVRGVEREAINDD